MCVPTTYNHVRNLREFEFGVEIRKLINIYRGRKIQKAKDFWLKVV